LHAGSFFRRLGWHGWVAAANVLGILGLIGPTWGARRTFYFSGKELRKGQRGAWPLFCHQLSTLGVAGREWMTFVDDEKII
jgi:hypothetical protein